MPNRHRGAPAIAIFAVALAFPSAARADEWTRTDTAIEVGCGALLIADWRQTLDRRYEESNAILGRSPGAAAVTDYFLAVMALQFASARLLPHPWRTLFQGITLGTEGRSVYNNWQLGARLLW